MKDKTAQPPSLALAKNKPPQPPPIPDMTSFSEDNHQENKAPNPTQEGTGQELPTGNKIASVEATAKVAKVLPLHKKTKHTNAGKHLLYSQASSPSKPFEDHPNPRCNSCRFWQQDPGEKAKGSAWGVCAGLYVAAPQPATGFDIPDVDRILEPASKQPAPKNSVSTPAYFGCLAHQETTDSRAV